MTPDMRMRICQCCGRQEKRSDVVAPDIRERTILAPSRTRLVDSSDPYKLPEARVIESTLCQNCAQFISALLGRLT